MFFSLALYICFIAASAAPFDDIKDLEQRQDPEAPCASGAHIVTARGSNSQVDNNALYNLAQQIKGHFNGYSTVYDVGKDADLPYPATSPQNYQNSETQGYHSMITHIEQYITRCPSSKIVLMGYSQGAQVVMDVLCGSAFGAGGSLPSNFASHIYSAAVIADPTRTYNQPYNVGYGNNPAGGDVDRPSSELPQCNRFTGRLRSWCASGDAVCDSGTGPNAGSIHTSYFTPGATNYISPNVQAFVLNPS